MAGCDESEYEPTPQEQEALSDLELPMPEELVDANAPEPDDEGPVDQSDVDRSGVDRSGVDQSVEGDLASGGYAYASISTAKRRNDRPARPRRSL